MGTSPYFSLIGTTLKICAFIMVLAPMNDIFIHNKNLIVTQDADISVLLRNLYAHLNDLSLFDQMSEITPFLGLYFVALGYVMFLMIIKNLNSKGRRYSATLDHNTNAHNFKGRE